MRPPELTVFYNEACPVCRREIDHYRRAAARSGVPVAWCGSSTGAAALEERGVSPETAVARLHAVDRDGRLIAGIDAFIAVWARLPRWRLLARILSFPPLRAAASLLYERVAAPLLVGLHRRRVRTRGATALANTGSRR